jgi:hypothetical protein
MLQINLVFHQIVNNQAVQNNKPENQGSSTTGQVKGIEDSNSRLYAYILIPSALLIAAGELQGR